MRVKTISVSLLWVVMQMIKSVKASSKEEAKRIIKEYLAKNITNIDIGIMQINWRWHSKEFEPR